MHDIHMKDPQPSQPPRFCTGGFCRHTGSRQCRRWHWQLHWYRCMHPDNPVLHGCRGQPPPRRQVVQRAWQWRLSASRRPWLPRMSCSLIWMGSWLSASARLQRTRGGGTHPLGAQTAWLVPATRGREPSSQADSLPVTFSCLQCAAGVDCTPTAPLTVDLSSDYLLDSFVIGCSLCAAGVGSPLETQAFGVLDPQLPPLLKMSANDVAAHRGPFVGSLAGTQRYAQTWAVKPIHSMDRQSAPCLPRASA